MLDRLLVCAIAWGVATTPAMAGDRSGFHPRPHAGVLLAKDTGATFQPVAPAASTLPAAAMATTALPLPAQFDLHGAGRPASPPPITPRTSDNADLTASAVLPASHADLVADASSHYALPEGVAVERDWLPYVDPLATLARDRRMSDRLSDARQYVGRNFRRHHSPLDTMLTLRIDGRDETPLVSVRGNIAGAAWTAAQH
jgi:hypothetical protein